jgi:hypothetical protein
MASKLSNQEVQVSLKINGQQAENTVTNLSKEMTELSEVMKNLEATGKQNTDEYKKVEKQYEQTVKTAKEMHAAQAAAAAQQADMAMNAGKSLKKLEQEYKSLYSTLRTLSPESDQFKQKIAEVAAKKGAIDELKNSFKGVKDEIKESSSAALSMGDLLKGATVAGAAMATADMAIEAVQAIAQEVQAVTKLRGEIASLTGEQGAALDAVTAKVKGISVTFEQDQQEIMVAANAVAKQFGISTAEALTIVEDGFLAGANASGEMLSQLKEYPAQFAAAGLSADEMMAILAKSTKEGIFSDKGADVVKEFGLRIREQTSATSDAMNAAFGPEFTQKIFGGINDGSMSSVEALKLISGQMDDTAIPANKLQTVIADVFGGPGEDAGLAYLQSLKDIETTTAQLIDTTDPYVQQQLALQSANEDLAAAQVELSQVFAATGSSMDVLKTKGQEFLVKVLTVLITAFVSVKDAVVGLYNASPIFQAFIDHMTSGIRMAYDGVMNFTNVWAGFRAAALQSFQNVSNGFKSLAIDAEIAFLKLKSLNPWADDAAIAAEIAILERAKATLSVQYQSLGEAFGTAYKQGLNSGMSGKKATNAAGDEKGGGGKFLGQDPTEDDEGKKKDKKDKKGKQEVVLTPEEELARDLKELEGKETKKHEKVRELTGNHHNWMIEEETLYKARLKQLDDDELKNKEAHVASQNSLQQAKLSFFKTSINASIELLSMDEKARKKNAKVIGAIAKTGIAMDLTQEIQGIWKNAMSSKLNAVIPGWGLAFGAIQTALAVGRSVKAMKDIDKQYAKGGIAGGQLHSNGGTKMVDGATGQVVGEMESGEPYMILSRKTYANNRPVVDKLLYSSMHRDGAPIFETGGVFSGTAPRVPVSSTNTADSTSSMISELISEQRMTRQAIQRMSTTLKANVVYQDVEEAGTLISEIRGNSIA